MTNHLHTTIYKIHFWLFGWVFSGTQVSIKYFRESINSKKESVRKQPLKVRHFCWKYPGNIWETETYLVTQWWMYFLLLSVLHAMTALLWKNILDYSLSCTSTKMSGMIWLSKPSVPKWRKRLNKCISVSDPQVETTKLVARQNAPS